jgi:serine/threonine-protein kinase
VDRSGNVEPVPAPQREYESGLAISPDGLHAALQVGGATQTIWIYDFVRATLNPFVTEGSSQTPVWSPDGKHIAYLATKKGFRNIYWRAADGSGDEEQLTRGENLQIPRSFSPDGKWLAYRENSPTTGNDLFVLPLEGDRTPKAFLKTQANELAPVFSPDGKWLAYHSNESGRLEVYVRPFPGPGPKTLVSTGGGSNPLWARNGKEMFYLDGDKTMSVDIATEPKISVGLPHLLYKGDFLPMTAGPTYGISNDGKRFLRIQSTNPEPATAQINVVINWFEELRQVGRARK